jgi:serine/threonine-protein kinase HipA
MPQILSVFLNRKQAGTLTFAGMEDIYDLEYNQSWITGVGFPISPHLKPQENNSEKIKRFLSNLLPEGKWLEELSVNSHLSKSNIFGLIAKLGEETAGALSFYFIEANQKSPASSFRAIPSDELKERIKSRSSISIAAWDGKQRLSVAGMQEKLPLLIKPDGQYGFGEGELASTHIMKFNNRPDTHMVINEFLCMKLARMVNIPAAEVSLKYFDEPVLLVERFDRQWNGGIIDRLHIIDGCQMLDLPPTYKYERPFGTSGHAGDIRTGASLPQLFNAADLCRVPAKVRMDLLNWILFQLIIGNCDAHGKNVSFFVRKDGIDFAPAYDMLNVDIYGDLFDHEMAMAIGDEFSLDSIQSFQLAEFCEGCSLNQRLAAKNLGRLCNTVLSSLDNLKIDIITNSDEKDFAMNLIKDIKIKALRFKEVSLELPGIKI